MMHIQRLEQLVEVGIALSAESDADRLLEKILDSARHLANADGGTLYSVEHDVVRIEILRNDSLGLNLGGPSGSEHDFAPIPLFKEDGRPNLNNVVTYAVHHNTTVNIADSYDTSLFDFSGTRRFDALTGYHSQSFLTVPLRNHEDEIVGVLQLINAKAQEEDHSAHPEDIIAFDAVTVRLIEALASQAAIILTKEQLISDMQTLFDSFIRVIADAIDRKSAYTGGHCRRVPELTMMLAEAVHAESEGPLKDFHLDDADRRELEIAGWLHDCGKITTPEYVVDKSTKLETIFDRVETVATRIEVLKRDAEIAALRHQLATLGVRQLDGDIQRALDKEQADLDADLAFIRHINQGGEFMRTEDQERVRRLAQKNWQHGDQPHNLLEDSEIKSLCVQRGTLTAEERDIINDHIVATIEMLNALPFPKHLRHVPEYASGHHERMDGRGYPRGLRREQMSIPARIIGIADIFEALTAADRPYKRAKKLSEALLIMQRMKEDGHIDPDLFEVFLRQRVYQRYAERFLDPSQWDAGRLDEASNAPGV